MKENQKKKKYKFQKRECFKCFYGKILIIRLIFFKLVNFLIINYFRFKILNFILLFFKNIFIIKNNIT